MSRDSSPDDGRRPDPLIDEIHAIRRELSERFGNDVYRLGRYLQEQERRHPERLVHEPPRDDRGGGRTGWSIALVNDLASPARGILARARQLSDPPFVW